MKAVIYRGPGKVALEEKLKPISLSEAMKAYDVFENASKQQALKVILQP